MFLGGVTQSVMRPQEKNDSKMTPVTCTNVYKKYIMELAAMADMAHREPEDDLGSTGRVNWICKTENWF